MTTLADVRSDVGALLASAVDSLTWTTSLLDAAIRLGLAEVDSCLVYESDVTVTTADYEQDLSGIDNLLSVLALAYPWTTGADFARPRGRLARGGLWPRLLRPGRAAGRRGDPGAAHQTPYPHRPGRRGDDDPAGCLPLPRWDWPRPRGRATCDGGS